MFMMKVVIIKVEQRHFFSLWLFGKQIIDATPVSEETVHDVIRGYNGGKLPFAMSESSFVWHKRSRVSSKTIRETWESIETSKEVSL